ncbi:MAG: ABC transporter permease [Clostridia bacterium]|nr:ABC transporter permease [Clostridia bacterium]
MEENKDLVQNTNENNTAEQNFEQEELTVTQATDSEQDNAPVDIQLEDGESPLDKNVKLMSPTRMVLRRFFRSKLSIAGLVMLIALFVFSWLGPVICPALGYDWGEIETDRTGNIEYTPYEVEGENGSFVQIIVTDNGVNALAPISPTHILGTDEQGMDIFTRLMYGGRLSLSLSFLAVFLTSFLGIVMGGIAGFYGGVVDNIIMRLCDILICLPTLPLMLIIGTVLDANPDLIKQDMYIYVLMGVLSLFSWPGMARLVRGQILFLREQEYMTAAEAMGYSASRRIFKHLIPNILPQIIVSMTLSLGSMILYESTLSYLGLGVKIPYASWGTMIEVISKRSDILQNNFNVWGPPGLCIIIAVLGFNFIGDGLRDALDPKQRR